MVRASRQGMEQAHLQERLVVLEQAHLDLTEKCARDSDEQVLREDRQSCIQSRIIDLEQALQDANLANARQWKDTWMKSMEVMLHVSDLERALQDPVPGPDRELLRGAEGRPEGNAARSEPCGCG